MKELEANQVLSFVRVIWQYSLNLLRRSDDSLVLTGEAMDQDQSQSALECSPYTRALETLLAYRLKLQMSFEDEEAVKHTLP